MAIRAGRNETSGPDKNVRGSGYTPFAQSGADVARAQNQAAGRVSETQYRDRITATRKAEGKMMQERKLFEQRAGSFASQNKVPIERARQLLDPDNKFGGARPAPTATPKQSAINKVLSKLRGKGKPMGLPGGDLKNLRR